MVEEQEPFLGGESIKSRAEKKIWKAEITKRFVCLVSAFNLIVLIANILISINRANVSSTLACYEHFPNRISGAVAKYEHQPRLFTKFQNSPYTGLPREENDKAWHDLMENMVIRITDKELARGNQSSLALPNGGYMAWLGVYHELHCIKMLRQFKYADHYHPHLKPNSSEYAHLSVHADHCLEMLRASAMCHADGSLTTFKWSPNAAKPMLDLTRPIHKCVSWDSMMDSLKGRFVEVEELEKMVNPAFNGAENDIGDV